MGYGRAMLRLRVVDSHTGGEPTRVVLDGGPDLGGGTVADAARGASARASTASARAVVNEPRGSDVVVGALLCPPADPDVRRGRHLLQQRRLPRHVRARHDRRRAHARAPRPARAGRASARDAGRRRHGPRARGRPRHGRERAELPAPPGGAGRRARRRHRDRRRRLGRQLVLPRVRPRARARRSRPRRRAHAGVPRGPATRSPQRASPATAAPIDHVELFGPPPTPGVDARNFVLCPGGAYDRSPCGTGTQRQARLPGRRRQARRGRDVAAGEHPRQRLRGPLPPATGEPAPSLPDDHRHGLRHGRGDAAARRRRPLRLGHRRGRCAS